MVSARSWPASGAAREDSNAGARYRKQQTGRVTLPAG